LPGFLLLWPVGWLDWPPALNPFRFLVEIGFLNLYNWRDFGYVWHYVSHGFFWAAGVGRYESIEKFLMIG
jgi:ABC-type multidrug transport system permease subunit